MSWPKRDRVEPTLEGRKLPQPEALSAKLLERTLGVEMMLSLTTAIRYLLLDFPDLEQFGATQGRRSAAVLSMPRLLSLPQAAGWGIEHLHQDLQISFPNAQRAKLVEMIDLARRLISRAECPLGAELAGSILALECQHSMAAHSLRPVASLIQ